jgi:hypothetical protein
MRESDTDITTLRLKLTDIVRQRDEYWQKNVDMENKMRDYDRMRIVDDENRGLRDTICDNTHQRSALEDRLHD